MLRESKQQFQRAFDATPRNILVLLHNPLSQFGEGGFQIAFGNGPFQKVVSSSEPTLLV